MPKDAVPRTRHALVALAACHLFEELDIAATLWDLSYWRVLHARESLILSEAEHGVERERNEYNERSLARAIGTGRPVLSELRGLSDLFVPIVDGKRALGALVCGPFFTERPTAAHIRARWQWQTGSVGHPRDPQFAHFVAASLATLVLEGPQAFTLARAMGLIGQMLLGSGSARRLQARFESLRAELRRSREAERLWEAARSMLDDRTARSWLTPYRDLPATGLRRVPDSVLVGLAVARDPDRDPLEDWVARHEFHRSCAVLVRRTGWAVSGRLGEHGITVLSAATGPDERRRARLAFLGERIAEHAGAFGLRLHLGASDCDDTALGAKYEQALAAAEDALTLGARWAFRRSAPRRPQAALQEARHELATIAARTPRLLPAAFERYLATVARQAEHHPALAESALRVAYERIAEAALESGFVDPRSLAELSDGLERSAQGARTSVDLWDAYRSAVSDISNANAAPVESRRERSLRRAVGYMRAHAAQPLPLARVAKVAGFAPNHFSMLFKAREKMTFVRYLLLLRIERAKQLITGTSLEFRQVARLAGFGGRHYFAGVFKRIVGATPGQYRAADRASRSLWEGRKRHRQRAGGATGVAP